MTTSFSNSEILARAAELRGRADGHLMFTPHESEILFKADSILNSRKSSGIAGLVETAVAKVVGERRAAELALDRARAREAEIEALLAERAATEKNLIRQREILQKLENMAAEAARRVTPEAEAAHFGNRFAHVDDYRLPQHLNQVALEILQARVVADFLPTYVERQRQAVEQTETRLREISKLAK